MNNEEALKDITDILKTKVEELGDPYPNVWYETLIKCKAVLGQVEKYHWHDLQKNPDDLPEEELEGINTISSVDVLCMTESAEYVTAYFKKYKTGDVIWFDCYSTRIVHPIAWRHIEPFGE